VTISDREPIQTLTGSDGVCDPAALAWAFPDVSPGIAPLGARVLVQLRRIQKDMKVGNLKLILTEEVKENEKWQNTIGRVVALGPLAFKNRDTMQPWAEGTWAQVGDYLRVPRWGGDRWERVVPGEDKEEPALFMILNDHEIIGKVTDDPLSFKVFI